MSEVKLTVLGGGGVGKSCLTIRFTHSKFIDKYDPTIEDTHRRQVEVDGTPALLSILDTAGQEIFAAMRDQWMRAGTVFLVVFAVTDRTSFQEVDEFVRSILRVKNVDSANETAIILVANKSDVDEVDRAVSSAEVAAKADELSVRLIETSAKSGVNVTECFEEAVRLHRKSEEGGGEHSGPRPPRRVMKCMIL